MVDFVNKLELSDQKYQTNGNVIYENYKGKFLFPMKYFLSFGTNHQPIYLITTRFLKDKIYGVRVLQFQLSYTCILTHPAYKSLIGFYCEVHYMWWVNQDLELQEWEDIINSNKTRILSIIILVPNKNPQ